VTELGETVACVMRGELPCTPRLAATLFQRLALHASHRQDDGALGLTAREREILTLIDGGLSNKEIAHRLNIEVATVKNHVHRILDKLHVKRRGEAAARIRGARSAERSRTLDARRDRPPSDLPEAR
jgi:DNA-binding NarL/FixJ family response regulator